MRYSMRKRSGMTLVEILISVGIFLIASIGIIYSFAKCIELNEVGKRTTIAVQAVKNKIEEIKASNFAQIHTNYDHATFSAAGVGGIGVVYIDNSNSKLLTVKVVFCVRVPGGRVIGEDANLNGVLNTGEDKNGNGEIDSSIQIITKIYG